MPSHAVLVEKKESEAKPFWQLKWGEMMSLIISDTLYTMYELTINYKILHSGTCVKDRGRGSYKGIRKFECKAFNECSELFVFSIFLISFYFIFRLILGIMLTTSFLSMWLSNTATTAMMLPIAHAILISLFGDLDTLKENCKIKDKPTGEFSFTKDTLLCAHLPLLRCVSFD